MYAGTGPTYVCGDRPHESLIFQCFSAVDLATTPIFGLLDGFFASRWLLPRIHIQFIFLFRRCAIMYVSTRESGGRKDYKHGKNGKNQEV